MSTAKKKITPKKTRPLGAALASKMAERGYVRASQAAARLGVVTSTVYNWIRRRLVAVERHGGATYVSIEGLLSQLGAERARVTGVTTDPKTWVVQ